MPTGVSERCVTLVKEFEGFGDTRRYGAGDPRRGDPYRCPAGVWTQGYGRTRGITERSPRVTEGEATAHLREDMAEYARGVAAVLARPATQNQFDAMVSLAFNIGLSAFGRSTVLRKFNAGDTAGAAEAFRLWNKAGGQVSPGLVRRRAREVELFLEGEAAPMPQRVDEPVQATPDNNAGPAAAVGTAAGGGFLQWLASLSPDQATGWLAFAQPLVLFVNRHWFTLSMVVTVAALALAVRWYVMRQRSRKATA